jgi:SAM-dependent methyltransferase
MFEDHIFALCCPRTGNNLNIENAEVDADGNIRSGILTESASGNVYPVVNYIPRFVPESNYANNFGLQWNVHERTQFDMYSGHNLSKSRFDKETKWGNDLRNESILEVGSGSGRFTKHALETGAFVASFDYSSAVDANFRSNGHHKNLLLVQADVFNLPFRKAFFNKSFCFGVLQHTPDPRGAFFSILKHVVPGGKIAVDIYDLRLRTLLDTKYYVRGVTKRMRPDLLYKIIKSYIDFVWPMCKVIRNIPFLGPNLNWALLVADYSRTLQNADDSLLKEWAYLDTFDMLSPKYDKPKSIHEVRKWFAQAGITDIDVCYGYNGIEGRGTLSSG